MTQRYLVDLGNGVRGFLAYRYGPLARIGPAWADSPGTLREWRGSIIASITAHACNNLVVVGLAIVLLT